MKPELVRISKFLSYVLRHCPEAIGVELDEEGWADVDELLAACRRHNRNLTPAQLEQVVASNDKKRFAFSPDRRRIRASQGHSVPVELRLEPRQPPELLYHGTAEHFLDSIRRQGLVPGKRNHVHLSRNHRDARLVGRRHGTPVVLVVEAGGMHRAGLRFYLADNGVWLTDSVPPEYLQLPK